VHTPPINRLPSDPFFPSPLTPRPYFFLLLTPLRFSCVKSFVLSPEVQSSLDPGDPALL
jgi:hypothetical protein